MHACTPTVQINTLKCSPPKAATLEPARCCRGPCCCYCCFSLFSEGVVRCGAAGEVWRGVALLSVSASAKSNSRFPKYLSTTPSYFKHPTNRHLCLGGTIEHTRPGAVLTHAAALYRTQTALSCRRNVQFSLLFAGKDRFWDFQAPLHQVDRGGAARLGRCRGRPAQRKNQLG